MRMALTHCAVARVPCVGIRPITALAVRPGATTGGGFGRCGVVDGFAAHSFDDGVEVELILHDLPPMYERTSFWSCLRARCRMTATCTCEIPRSFAISGLANPSINRRENTS